jgi:hypothetical protein
MAAMFAPSGLATDFAVVLIKLPWNTDDRLYTLSAADISLLANTVKTVPNYVIFSIMDMASFQHPNIDQYLARQYVGFRPPLPKHIRCRLQSLDTRMLILIFFKGVTTD